MSRIKKFDIVKNWQAYALAIPALILFITFSIVPLPGIILAFKNYNIFDGYSSPWSEPLFLNFEFFFKSPDFLRTTRNVFLYNSFNLVFGTFITVLFAIMVNEIYSSFLKRTYQSILFLPFFFSVIVLGKLVQMCTDYNSGIFNIIIKGFGGAPLKWSDMTWQWLFIVSLAGTWKGLGYGIIIYMATLSSIDETIYEAAKVDGAGRFRQIFSITLPMLRSTIIMMTLLSIGRIFYGDFQMIHAIVGFNSNALTFTDNIETFMFRAVKQMIPPRFAMTTAVGIYQSILGFIMIFSTNAIVRKIDKDQALF